jgi:hypothetical protein
MLRVPPCREESGSVATVTLYLPAEHEQMDGIIVPSTYLSGGIHGTSAP